MKPGFILRARFSGTLDWLCPWCGYLNRCRIDRTSWRIRCKVKPCRRWFAHGLVLHSLGRLQHSSRKSLNWRTITHDENQEPIARPRQIEAGASRENMPVCWSPAVTVVSPDRSM